ncbi:hypothetical protein K5549_011371 [Capra hircus]|uniref:Lysozyme g1 n=1 Tax=Capra hircus TaxID=9925 RepID=A0A452EV46_CAPHI|nr:hypothetical protein K5549_011371 [Capra hircus]
MSVLWLLLGLLVLTGESSESSSWGCRGDIWTLHTPGASCGIGRRQGLSYCGLRASERLAEIDMPSLLRYRPIIHTVGQNHCLDPAVITGVLSRQSHGSNVLEAARPTASLPAVPWSLFPTSWFSEAQVSRVTEVLNTPDQYLRGGLCAYTGGAGYIRSSQDLSCDFCNDVLAQAKYFKRQGF